MPNHAGYEQRAPIHVSQTKQTTVPTTFEQQEPPKNNMPFSSLPLRNAIRMTSARSMASHRTLATAAIAAATMAKPASSAKFSSLLLNTNKNNNSKRLFQVGGLALTLAAAQYSLGNANDFFEHRFITDKKSEDLADFYGTEGMSGAADTNHRAAYILYFATSLLQRLNICLPYTLHQTLWRFFVYSQ